MRKGLAYLDMAEKCRALAGQVKEAKNKKQLDDMAQQCERMASAGKIHCFGRKIRCCGRIRQTFIGRPIAPGRGV